MSRDGKILTAIAAGLGFMGLVFVAVVLLLGRNRQALSTPGANADTSIAAGKLAPDFQLKDLNGHIYTLSKLRGHIVFLNLWATWCPPCREEMPSIQALYHEFAKDPDFVVLAVSEDAEPKPVPAYIKHNNFTFTVLLDPANKVGDAYNVSGLPESFVIGRDGRIVAHHIGPYDWANHDIRSALEDLIKAKVG